MKNFNCKIIDSMALQHNLKCIKKKINNCDVCVMIKANAYGHGLYEIWKCLYGKVEFFGVSNLQEALFLRSFDKISKVLIVGKCNDFKLAIENNISVSVSTIQELKNIKNLGKTCNIHMKINVGMNRYGIKTLNYFKEVLSYFKSNKNINLEGVFSHFNTAENSKKEYLNQLNIFKRFLDIIPNNICPIVHIGGSFILNYEVPEFVNMVRVGYFLYGYGDKELKSCMLIKSKIAEIHKVKKGERVSYNDSFFAEKDITVATVPLGYGDGIPRQLSNKFHVKVCNKLCRSVGVICMDCFMIDISNTDAKVGSTVDIFSGAEYWAEILDTSPYEILTNFSSMRGDVKIKNF